MPNNLIFAQEQNIDEFLEWPSENNFDSILISIVVLIALAILGNYLWSKRKGRKYSEE